MPLKPCHECGEEISTSAKFCPRCGAPSRLQATAEALDGVGKSMQGCGCILTLLVTVPILLLSMCAL